MSHDLEQDELDRALATRSGLDVEKLSGHSLRTGFVPSAAENRASISRIMEVTRHRDPRTVETYVRRGDRFKDRWRWLSVGGGRMPINEDRAQWRDGAIMMTVGTEDEGGVIELLPVGSALYVIKEKATYVVKTADSIDPQRKNAKIPHVNQLFMKAGAQDELFIRTVLTAKVLFDKKQINCPDAVLNALLDQVLLLASNLVAAQEIARDYERDLTAAIAPGRKSSNGVLSLPAISGLENRVRSFHQKIEHSIQRLYRIWPAFYPQFPEERFFEGFAKNVAETYGAEDGFTAFSAALGEFARDVRNIRHCIEHEKRTQKLIVTDFSVTPDAEVMAPTIEVIHPQSPVPMVHIDHFMEGFLENAVTSVDLLLAHLASKADRRHFGFDVIVAPVPKEEGRRWDSSYGYFAVGEDGLVPFG
ncbi:hypothetical protein [Rhizobium leguminosarum]|uniref:hypothetical protein n=1 Tax=Rhizobium leguminosarum TaxID=384 RepID=UPI000424C402|nr:hypothetical protein [Rhizobium leguminosarum]